MEEGENLAPAFAFLGKAFLAAEAEGLSALLRRADGAGPPAGWELLHQALRESLENEPEALGREYVRLFLNPAGAPCPPWQSAYGDEPQRMGPSHRSALAWYRAGGMEPRNPVEPADHIGLLLSFYAHMLESGSAPEIRESFVMEHLAWIPEFCARLSGETRHAFYRLLADAAKSLLERLRPA